MVVSCFIGTRVCASPLLAAVHEFVPTSTKNNLKSGFIFSLLLFLCPPNNTIRIKIIWAKDCKGKGGLMIRRKGVGLQIDGKGRSRRFIEDGWLDEAGDLDLGED